MAEETRENGSWRQYLAAGSASIGMVCAGTVIGWSSPSLVILLSEDSPITITYKDIAWMTAISTASSPVAPIACTHFIDKFGRKPVLLISGVFYVINWLVGALARNAVTLLISKVFAGLAAGISLRYTLVYTAEIAEVTKRGAFGVMNVVSISVGILFPSIFGPRMSFSALQFTSMIFPVFFTICFLWMPETPHFLISRNRIDQAYESLMWLRGQTEKATVEDEIQEMKIFSQMNHIHSFRETIRKTFSHRNRRALILMLALFFGQHFSGMLSFALYTELIFTQIDSPINPPDAVVILNFFGLVFVFVSAFAMDRMGRKILVLISLLGSCLSNALIGTYLILANKNILGTESAWIAMLGLFGYKAFFSIGLASIPMIVSSEIFQSELKIWSLCILALYEAVIGFIIAKIFQVVDETIGAYFNYYVYSVSCLLTIILLVFLMPETKNKSFDEIQELLDGKNDLNLNTTVEKYVTAEEGNGSNGLSEVVKKPRF